MKTAKVFWSGRSQAVRLPKSFRFNGSEVAIRRDGHAVILEPTEEGWSWLDDLTARPMDQDFEQAALEKAATSDRSDIAFPE